MLESIADFKGLILKVTQSRICYAHKKYLLFKKLFPVYISV